MNVQLRETQIAVAILAVTGVLYAAMAAYDAYYGQTWIDEITYVVKSWSYLTGALHPYSDQDATWYMPLYFYQLGAVEMLFGTGVLPGRIMSMALGALSAALVYLICRRLKLSAPVAAIAVAVYLLTPSTAYYFATVTPIATVACLLLFTVLVVLNGEGKDQPGRSVALGFLFAALYFYRQNMILAIGPLAIAYLALIPGRRGVHALLMIAPAAAVTAVILALFPARLALYAIRLPLLTPVLHRLGLLPDVLREIEETTTTNYALSLRPGALSWRDPVNAFLLPYLGTVILVLAIFALRPSRMTRFLAAFFFFLALTHYLGSAGYCSACILTYTNYFAGIGALAGAFALEAAWRRYGVGTAAALALAAILLNGFGNALTAPLATGTQSPYRNFPWPLMYRQNGVADIVVAGRLAQIVARETPREAKVLVLDDQPALAYAVFRAGRTLPVQGLNLRQSYRRLRDGLSEPERARAATTLEAESLWTDDTVLRWLGDPQIGVVMHQPGAVPLLPASRALLDENFRLSAHIVVLGRDVDVYRRKAPAL